jgi:hypothetical protein
MNTAHPFCLVDRDCGTGTALVGYVETTYGALVALLGMPQRIAGDKITAEWGFRCADGTRFTVYDWKQSATPLGLYRWHIGGNSARSVDAFNARTGLQGFSAF